MSLSSITSLNFPLFLSSCFLFFSLYSHYLPSSLPFPFSSSISFHLLFLVLSSLKPSHFPFSHSFCFLSLVLSLSLLFPTLPLLCYSFPYYSTLSPTLSFSLLFPTLYLLFPTLLCSSPTPLLFSTLPYSSLLFPTPLLFPLLIPCFLSFLFLCCHSTSLSLFLIGAFPSFRSFIHSFLLSSIHQVCHSASRL